MILKLLICCIIHYKIQRKSITGNSILGENYKILYLLKYFIAGCLNLHVYGCYYRRKVIQTVSVICAGIQRTIPSSAVHVIGISFTGMWYQEKSNSKKLHAKNKQPWTISVKFTFLAMGKMMLLSFQSCHWD